MATTGVSPEALELLQQYAIDVKDFTRARARYMSVLHNELVPKSADELPEVVEAVHQAQQRLKDCWQEYVRSTQTFFSRVAGHITHDIANPNDQSRSANNMSRMSSIILSSGGSPSAGANTNNNTVIGGNNTNNNSAVAGGGEGSGSGGPLDDDGNNNSPNSESGDGASAAAMMLITAGRMNDLCVLCEKWYLGNEQYFDLPCPEELAHEIANAVSSSSRLMRLLGMRIAHLCAGSSVFIRTLLKIPKAAQWIGLCGDRELFSEVESLMNLMEHMVELIEADPKAYPQIPFGWYYRIVTILDPTDALPNVPPKRRSQAIRLSLRLLSVFPAPSTAVSLHTVLLRNCLVKGGATPEEMSSIIKKLLDMFDAPSTRKYMHMSDIAVLFAPFLDTSTTVTAETLETLNLAKDMLVKLLFSNLGSMWVSCETTCLRSLIDVLHLPGELDRKMVIFTLFNRVLTRLVPHRGMTLMATWNGAEEDKRRRLAEAASAAGGNGGGVGIIGGLGSGGGAAMVSTPADQNASLTFPSSGYDNMLMSGSSLPGMTELSDDFVPTTKALGYHVMDPLLGRVLLSFTHHGLPLALISILQSVEKNRVVMESASRLLQDMFVLMDTVLPKATVSKLHETFNRAVGRLANEGDLFVGGLTSQLFHNYKTNKHLDCGMSSESVVMLPSSQLCAIPLAAGGTDWDDATFENTIRETRVFQCPSDYRAWNLDLLLLLVQGPLCNRRRLQAARPLLKILIAFFAPRGKDEYSLLLPFSSLRAEDITSQTCVLGIELIDLLLSTREGAKMLDEAQFAQAVYNMLQEVRNNNTSGGAAPYILSKERVNSRVGQTLLRITGRLSAYANGLLLMREYDVFGMIDSLFAELQGARLSAPPENDTLSDVCFQLLQYLFLGAVPNYGVCDEVRCTFRAALINASNSIRLCAAMQLKKVVWRDLSTSLKWGIETLVQVLHDDFFSVVESAFKLLLSICLCSNEGLDYLISLFPTVLMESEVILAHAKQLNLELLLYRIAGRPSGFRFLQCYGWIDEELSRWEKGQSSAYLDMIERMQFGEGMASGGAEVGHSPGSGNSSRRFHGRSLSDMSLSGVSYKGSPATAGGFLPLLGAENSAHANFFPTHFAAVLCKSSEGCAMFKHSELWSRSVTCLLEQQLPPDIVCDDSSCSDTDSDSEDSEDMNMGGELAPHSVAIKPSPLNRHANIAHSGEAAVGPMSLFDQSLPTSGFARRAAAASFVAPSAMTLNAPGASAATATTSAGVDGEASTAAAHDINRLMKGVLSSEVAISAARGYKPVSRSFSMVCVGNIAALKDAIMVVSQVGSSDVGYSLVRATPGLQRRLSALSRFASTMSVRCVSLMGADIMARARRAEESLVKEGYAILNNPNAYVSASGVPYAVSFAHMKPSKSMSIAGKTAVGNTTPRHAYAQYDGPGTNEVAKRIWDSVFALSNPVSRENAKAVLHKMLQRHPHAFLEPNVQRLCLDVCSLYRMRHAERKFLANVLEMAQTVR